MCISAFKCSFLNPDYQRGTQKDSQAAMNSFTWMTFCGRCHEAICSVDNEVKMHTLKCTNRSGREAPRGVNHCVFGTLFFFFFRGRRAWVRTLRRKSLRRSEAAPQGHEYMLEGGRLCVGTLSHSGGAHCVTRWTITRKLLQFSLVI